MTEDQFKLLESDVLDMMVERVKKGIVAKESQRDGDDEDDRSNTPIVNQAVSSPSNMEQLMWGSMARVISVASSQTELDNDTIMLAS